MDERECSGGHQSTSLMKAARYNQIDLVVTALECTATNLDAVGADGRTALMIACEAGHLEVAKAMANAGTDIDVQDGAGRTAVDIAAGAGHDRVAAMLRAEATKRRAAWDAIVGASAGGGDDAASLEQMLADVAGGGSGARSATTREAPF